MQVFAGSVRSRSEVVLGYVGGCVIVGTHPPCSSAHFGAEWWKSVSITFMLRSFTICGEAGPGVSGEFGRAWRASAERVQRLWRKTQLVGAFLACAISR